MRGYEVDEMVEAHCKEVGMDDLRERVGDVFFHQSSIEEMTNKIIALVDAEYRPLLAQAREALRWILHLHHGISKGGEDTSPPSDAEWKEALDGGIAAITALDARLGGKA